MMKGRTSLLIAVLISIGATTELTAQHSVIEEEIRTITTYPFSDPSPLPVFLNRPAIYPYYTFEGFSTTGEPRQWKVVRLENDYVRVFVLPEVGGKVYGAQEKSTGEEFVYLNEVLKFRQIALRGPWTSGGSEFNFGLVGHTPACATPVDYLLRENPDGSVSCIIGNIDLPSRTRWSVDIRLPNEKAFFELRSLWYNPSPLHQSYYVWTNNAVRIGDDLEYFYPGNMVVPHGYTVPPETWPVDSKGRDLSWYRNNNFGGSKSHFVLGEYEDFYGGYWHDTDFGFGHWALYDDMPGKKMWIWALSRQGAIWEQLLTDINGQYSEPQAGRLFSQSDHAFFAPYSGDRWREILFPYKETGGLVKASPAGALNVERGEGSVSIRLCALQPLDDDLILTLAGKEVYRERIKLEPMEVFSRRLDMRSGGFLEVVIEGKIRYADDPAANDLNRPINFHRYDENSTEGLYLAGEFLEKQRNYGTALRKYLSCLESEPLHTRALTRVAELYYRRGEYGLALDYARKALENVMYDAGANYIYGIISRKLGNLVDAKETLGWAARSMEYRSNAYCQLAELCLIEGDLELAVEYSQRSLDFNRYNLRAYEIGAIVHRLLEHPDRAEMNLMNLLQLDPLNHLARFELYMLEPASEKLDAFKSMIRNELPHEHYLEIAISYAELGLTGEAVSVLEQAPEYPMVNYWLAWLLRDESDQESARHLKEAARLSPRLVFPFREESIQVLRWASEQEPANWKSRYYLGLIYGGMGRIDETRRLFLSCGEPDFAPLHLIMGHLDQDHALAHFSKALEIDESEWRNWHYLIDYCNRQGMLEEALEHAENASTRHPDQIVLSIDYAGSLFSNARYKECLTLLDGLEVLPYEGGWEAHDLFMRTSLHLGFEKMRSGEYREAVEYLESSKEYPERLGTGEPYNVDVRLQDYLSAVCYERIGNREKARESRERINNYTERNWTERGSYHYFGLLSLRDTGENEKAAELVENLKSGSRGNRNVEWAIARFTGDIRMAEEIERRQGGDPRFGIMVKAAELISP